MTFLRVNGVKMHGFITWCDGQVGLLRQDVQTQLIYKHASRTVMPSIAVNLSDTTGSETKADREPILGDELF